MPLKIDRKAAEAVLREEAATAGAGPVDPGWEAKVERLSELCGGKAPKTHIAFLGTAILAKAVDARADLRAIKPDHDPSNPNAFSARTLSEEVLVPVSAELGFSLGVSGRQPLNNQPYFRMRRLGDGTPVRGARGRAAFDCVVGLVDELQGLDSAEARRALRAFVAVRRRHQRRYGEAGEAGSATSAALLAAVRALVSADSEGGRRAQAVVAGLLDVVAGTGRVETGRVNDPSRHYPGDVAVLAAEVGEGAPVAYEKAFEVRDKPVRFSDVALFGRTCVDRGVREAAMVLVSDAQSPIEEGEVRRWAEGLGVGMTLFVGWDAFVGQCLFWASPPQPEAAALAVETVRDRLIEVEASAEAVAMWDRLTRISINQGE